MVAFSQYTDSISITIETAPAKDAEGIWQPGGSSTIFESLCRAEPNGKGQVIRGADGNEKAYAWNIYMTKPDDTVIPEGAEVTLTLEDGSIHTGQVKRFKSQKFNARLWV